jgi:hypothetical protein
MSAFKGIVTITITPDGTIVTQWETVTLPKGAYSLLGEWQSGAYAQAVQIRFQISATGPTGLNAGPTATNTANTANTANTQSRGLSDGTKIALGVAIPVVILAFLAGIFLGFRWRASSHRERHAHDHEAHDKAELDNRPAVGRQELGGEERPANGMELGGEERPADGMELDGEERQAGGVEAASRPVYEAGDVPSLRGGGS